MVLSKERGRKIDVYSNQRKSFATPQSKEPSVINSLLVGPTDFPNGYGSLSKSEGWAFAVGILETQRLWLWAGDEVFVAELVRSLHACHHVCWWDKHWETWAVKLPDVRKPLVSPTWVLIILHTGGTLCCASSAGSAMDQFWEFVFILAISLQFSHLMSLKHLPSH